jgi:hypothetical protein
MFLASLCAFPPLILNEPLSLTSAGSVASKKFVVPVDKAYVFDLAFEFSSKKAFNQRHVLDSEYGIGCQDDSTVEEMNAERRGDANGAIPIHISIRRQSDGRLLVDRTFISRCKFAVSGSEHPTVWQKIGQVELKRGTYYAEVTNLEPQAGLDDVKTSFSLVGGHGK